MEVTEVPMNLVFFFLVFAATIIITRVWLWLVPKHGPTIFGFRPHHYVLGILLVILSFWLLKWLLLPIGLALIVDEIPLFFKFKGFTWPDDHWKQYHSWFSIIGILIISLLIFLLLNFSNLAK